MKLFLILTILLFTSCNKAKADTKLNVETTKVEKTNKENKIKKESKEKQENKVKKVAENKKTSIETANNKKEKAIKKEKELSEFYKYKAKDIYGKEISMEEYKGKVVLIVNVASKCGFTPQYKGLEKLYKEYKDKGLVILGFPSNQFAHQEPGTNEEIASFCKVNYGVTFPLFTKIDVNGKNAHPLYKYLKSEQSGLLVSKIKWNFTKFLIDSNGKPVKRYAPSFKPKKIEKDIKKLLNK